jgi:two-component system chemotaxis response regulator CheY
MFPLDTKILVVDPMQTLRKMVMNACKEIGFTNIQEAEDGAKAWEIILSSQNIKLVISDFEMPNCSGLDLLKRIRSDTRMAKLPFVILTTDSSPQKISDAAKAGVSAYLVKPCNTEVLRAKLEALHPHQ